MLGAGSCLMWNVSPLTPPPGSSLHPQQGSRRSRLGGKARVRGTATSSIIAVNLICMELTLIQVRGGISGDVAVVSSLLTDWQTHRSGLVFGKDYFRLWVYH